MATRRSSVSFDQLGRDYAARVLRRRTAKKTRFQQKEGPRGFQFGPVWTRSVLTGTGIAVAYRNRPKLIKHAQTLGLPVQENDPSGRICAAIAARLK